VFSSPGTFNDAIMSGSVDKWYKVVTDPGFRFQQLKRQTRVPKGLRNLELQDTSIQRDWSATLGSAGVAPDMYPAKWQFVDGAGTPSCTDYVVFGVNKAGVSGSQPNIVGYQNLYVNAGGTGVCAGTAPTVLFSYFVGTGTVQTSPVLGLSAGQIAYVESITGGSKFHVLKGAGTGSGNGSIAAPVAPGSGSSTASDVAVTLNGGVSVTRSSPYYDYAHDVAYVGDDSGVLHKISPVFNGTPAEITTGGWPSTVSHQASKILTGPVYDNGTVFVGDSTGFLYGVNSTSGAVTASGQLGSGTGIVDAPIVDSTAQAVYVFVGQNFAGTNSAVIVFNVSTGNIASGSTGAAADVGTNSATIPLYAGTFDNIYFNSANPAQPAGNIYVCGNAGGDPTLYQIPITYSSGPHLGTVVTGPVLASSNVGCSPLTEFYNTTTSTDWLFGSAASTSCGASGTTQGGCVMSFNVTSGTAPTIGPWMPSTAYALNAEIVDTSGRIQKCTGGSCGVAGSESGTTTPAWVWGTTMEGGANASSVGTISVNSAVSGATVTIGTLTLTASAPTAASSPILINSEPPGPSTLTINGTVYDWRTTESNCTPGENCIARSSTLATDQTNLINAINGTSCYNTCVGADPTVTAAAGATNTVIITAKTPGTGANADVLATNSTASMHINGAANASTTLGAGTGTLGTNGSNTAPNFQYWSGAAAASTAALASNISAAAAGNSANVTLTYTSGNTFTATGTGTNAGTAGNSVAIGGTLTGFSWNPTGHLAGGLGPLTWTTQSISNGQTTAPEATGTSGIIVDNAGSGAGEASVYFGTLSGTGATNAGVKMTQSGLN
jgi:hypothetical protein